MPYKKTYERIKHTKNMSLNLKTQKGGEIPKVIYRFWCDKTMEMPCGGRKLSTIPSEKTLANASGWVEKIMSDEECDEFVENSFNEAPEILTAYNLINPKYMAAKADLARLLMVYKYGGLYMDMKSCAIKQIPDIPNDKDMYSSHWDIFFKPHSNVFVNGELQNWYIYGRKEAPILKDIIEQIVTNIILTHKNPWHCVEYDMNSKYKVLITTGPIAMTLAINKSPNKDSVYINNIINKSLKYMCDDNHKITGNHYSLLKEPLIK